MTAVPYRTASPAALAQDAPRVEWLVEGLFLKGGAGILGGAPKSCKSFFALDLAVAVASATPCAGHFRVPLCAPALLLSAEDPHGVVVERLEWLARARGLTLPSLPLHVIVEHPVRLPDDLDRLAATVARHRPGLLLLDPLIRLHRADENSASEMSIILDGLRALARSTSTAILLVHHSRKAPAGPAMGTALRGSSDLHAFGDSNLYLRRLTADASLELKIEHRAAASPPALRLKLSIDGPVARFEPGEGRTDEDPLGRRILDVLRTSPHAVSGADLRKTLGVRNQTLSDLLARLANQGAVRRQGKGGWTLAPAPS